MFQKVNLPSIVATMNKFEQKEFKFFMLNNSAYGIRVGKAFTNSRLIPSGPILPLTEGLSMGKNRFEAFSHWIESKNQFSLERGCEFVEIFEMKQRGNDSPALGKEHECILKDLKTIPYFKKSLHGLEFNEVDLAQSEVNLMVIAPNSDIDGHTHPVGVSILVIKGRYFLTIDGHEKIYYPGDFIHIRPDLFHTVRSLEAVHVIEFWKGIDFWNDED